MTVDREQIRRDAELWPTNSDDAGGVLARHCLALLSELEQAEKHLRAMGQVAARAEVECNAAESRLAKVPALVEAIASALTSIATGPLKDGYAYSVLEEALAEWERE